MIMLLLCDPQILIFRMSHGSTVSLSQCLSLSLSATAPDKFSNCKKVLTFADHVRP